MKMYGFLYIHSKDDTKNKASSANACDHFQKKKNKKITNASLNGHNF